MDEKLRQGLIEALEARASVFFVDGVSCPIKYDTLEVALYFLRK